MTTTRRKLTVARTRSRISLLRKLPLAVAVAVVVLLPGRVVGGYQVRSDMGGDHHEIHSSDHHHDEGGGIPPDELLFQDKKDGYLCMGASYPTPDCWDSNDQHGILNHQLWWLENEPELTCKDLMKDMCSAISKSDCRLDPVYLHSYCPKTCGVCHNRTRVVDESMDRAPIRVSDGRTVVDAIGSDLGVPQTLKGSDELKDETRRIVVEARHYVRYTVNADDRYVMVRDRCRNFHVECSTWAARGRCDSSYEYMLENCPAACRICEELHYTARCPVDLNEKNALYPGDLNRMFERIVSDPHYRDAHNVTVLSRPDYVDGDTEETAAYVIGPWILMLDDFTQPAEAARLIKAAGTIGYQRSEDVGDEADDGEVSGKISEGRTSENAWCEEGDECEGDPLIQNVIGRIENLTEISREHLEYLQLLRYGVNQAYEEHHDYIELDRMRMVGSRILTVFLYLNDVEEGGGTHFSRLGLTVTPKLGRAVIWPSVLDEDPHTRDDRTHHQALPVKKGEKYAANSWIHQRKFRVALAKDC